MELVGHADRLQRSLLFTHFRLEQGPKRQRKSSAEIIRSP
jgi:hypothetical protein